MDLSQKFPTDDASGHIPGAVGIRVMSPSPMRFELWRGLWLQGARPTSATFSKGTAPKSVLCVESFALCIRTIGLCRVHKSN